MMDGHWTTVGGGGNRNFRVMSAFQAAAAAGFQAGGVGSTFPSAATFPHYAIQQGIPYNLYGYVYMLMYMYVYIYIWYIIIWSCFTLSLSLSLSPPLERCTCFANSCTLSLLILGLHLCMLIHHNPLSLYLSLSPFWSIEQHMQEQLINEKRNELPDFYTNYIFHNIIAFCHYCAFSFSYRRTISHYSCMKNTHMYGPFSVHQYMQ